MTLQSPLRRPSSAATALFVVALIAVPAGFTHAQEDPSGVWQGTLQIPSQTLDITVTLRADAAGALSGTIDIPAQNLAAFPLSDIAVADGSITFAMAGVPGDPVFKGAWDAAAQTISGNFEQGGGAFPFNLRRTGDAAPAAEAEATDPESAAKVAGDWQGTLNAGGQALQVIFHIEASDEGALSGTMDSPAQGQSGLPISKVSFDGSNLRLDLDYAGAYFEGALSADGSTVDGSWNQGGASFPLTIERQ